MSRKLSDLQPDVAEAAAKALANLAAFGIHNVVTSTLRTTAEQVALYAQGRKSLGEVNGLRVAAFLPPICAQDNTYTVTNCDGVTTKSNHQGGRALDVVPADVDGNPQWPPETDDRWRLISEAFKYQGFNWGGDWEQFKDLPHMEMPEKA